MSFIEETKDSLKKSYSIDYFSFDSGATNASNSEKSKIIKSKSVFFNGVEIIDIESYKDYYSKIGILKLETIEKNCSDDCKVCNCSIF